MDKPDHTARNPFWIAGSETRLFTFFSAAEKIRFDHLFAVLRERRRIPWEEKYY